MLGLRLTLVCLLILAKHAYFVLEQPSASILARHPRWEWFCNRVCYVFGLIMRNPVHS